jgi:short-subunit dehydrogenase
MTARQRTDNPAGRPVAVVTGASSGIGRETAFALARRGYVVFAAARRLERLEDVAAECDRLGGVGRAVRTDVAEREQVDALVAAAVGESGRLDVMVNNAGVGLFARVHETSEAEMRRIFAVNFHGVHHGCAAAAEVMIRQRCGHIFNVSSVIGKRGTPFHGAYCATKFAIRGLTDSLRVELAPYGVRVTCVCPSTTDTEFFEGSPRARAAGSSFARWTKPTAPEAIGRAIAAAVGKDRPEMVFTLGGKLLALIAALWPRAADRMMRAYHDDLARRLE